MLFCAEDENGYIFNQMHQELIEKIKDSNPDNISIVDVLGVKYRVLSSSSDKDGVRVLTASSDKKHIASNSLFKRESYSIIEIIKNASLLLKNEKEKAIIKSKEKAKSQAIKLIHNLKTLNAQNSQAVYLVIPQQAMNDRRRKSMTTSEFVSSLVEYVDEKKETTVKSLMRVAKNSMQFKSEIDVYNALINNDFRLKVRMHPIHRVVMNAFYVFFADFTDSFVNVKIGDSNSSVMIDYDTFQVAIYYVIENTTKYILPKTELHVIFNHDKLRKKVILTMSMISLKIGPDEEESIFNEGFSGAEARKTEKEGNGIGLNRCKSLLEHSKANIKVVIAPNELTEVHFGRTYQRNYFIIEMDAA